MKTIVIALFIIEAVLATQYVTIPNREVGILVGKPDAPVKIQLIYDPSCDDTAQFDPKFQKAFEALTAAVKQQISQRYISYSLPYHVAAQKQTQGIIYVLNNKGSRQAMTLFRDFLQHTDSYQQDAIKTQSINEIMTRIAQRISSFFGLKQQDVFKQLQHGSSTDRKLRGWSKVVMGSMKVASTPRLRINGVNIDNTEGLTVQQLTKLMNDLVNQTQQQSEQMKISYD